MEADQRPWIGFTGISVKDNAGFIYASVANSGKSPALNTFIVISGHAGKCAVNERSPVGVCTTSCSFTGMLLPNVPILVRVPRLGESAIGSDSNVCIIGRADYLDGDKPRESGFCFTYSHEGVEPCKAEHSNYAN
jgi:hypothetical protein